MIDVRVWVFLLAIIILFLSATAQASLVYIDRARLRHMLEEGTPRADALMRLLDEPTSSLSTILFVYTLALVAAASSAFWFDLEMWQSSPLVAIGLIVAQLVVLLLVQFLGRVMAL